MIVEQLRKTIKDIRRKPYPICDIIPLLVEAADELENRGHDIDELVKINNELSTELLAVEKKLDEAEQRYWNNK